MGSCSEWGKEFGVVDPEEVVIRAGEFKHGWEDVLVEERGVGSGEYSDGEE